ncbi:MAG: hypothetical protein AAB787_01400 [Patescibacteria group bacterium]
MRLISTLCWVLLVIFVLAGAVLTGQKQQAIGMVLVGLGGPAFATGAWFHYKASGQPIRPRRR